VSVKTGAFHVADKTGRIQGFDAAGKLLCEWSLPDVQYGQPVGIALESDGNLLVNDSHYHRILRYSPDGSKLLASWGSEGTGPGQFTFGRDIVVDSEGFIYAGDYGGGNDRIQKFSRDGRFILEWGGMGTEPGKFQRPQGMAVEKRGGDELLLVADAVNHRIQRFTMEGQWISSFGRLGQEDGALRYPYSVAVGADGTVFVCEYGNHRIQRFDPDGKSLGSWGRAGHGEGELAHPWDVAVGPDDRLYIADCENDRVQVIRWPAEIVAADRGLSPVFPAMGAGDDADGGR